MVDTDPKLRDFFSNAVQCQTPEEQAAYLEQICQGDAELRARLEELLQAHREAGSFLQEPSAAPSQTVDEPRGSERPSTVIGPYKLLQQIGEGGMGTVFMAEQTQPVQRKVALKVIKPGMDSRQVIARFEAERQALAMMDHANIARVLDAGATESGLPYFVMELVHGVPITKYCDDNRLTPRERLELFVPVCRAIQHAHQKGIIHRDIKPSNVMITLYDGKPVPKVIDFGVAKATEQKLTERTLFTTYGAMVGTLEYMSPEQAELSALGVDTRSDIFSLGVLLYELLTGNTPLTHKRMKEAVYGEILRMIKEEEPPRPSTRLSDSGEAMASISAERHMEPAKLTKLMRGELDWIVMKTLEKDRNRRYETANGLALDIKHYLDDEPVAACPPSTWYRFRKFARRNKGPVLAASLVLLALLGGVVGTTWGLVNARQQRDVAEEAHNDEATQRREADRQRLQAVEQKNRAKAAEEKGRHELYRSLVAQARVSRLSRRIGQRFQSLEVLATATKMAQAMNLPENDFLELRNETIACLALPDLRIAKEWNGWPTDSLIANFDSTVERYARVDRQGVVHIHRVGVDAELCHFAGIGPGEGWPWFSPDGRFFALSGPDSRFKVWKLAGASAVELMPEFSAPGGFAFSPDGTRLAIGPADGSIVLYELPSGRQLKRLEGLPPLRGMAFHPKGRQLAFSCATGVQVYNLETEKMLPDYLQCTGAYTLVWHPDGKTLAVLDADRIIHIFDVATHKLITRLEGHTGDGIVFGYNHAGDLLVSTSWDRTMRLWDPQTGQQLFSTRGRVVSLAFSQDDRFLAGEIADDKLRIWEVTVPSAYRTLARDPALERTAQYSGCAVSPNGRLLALTLTTGVSFWDLPHRKELVYSPTEHTLSPVFASSDALLTGGPAGLLRWPVQENVGAPGMLRIGPPTRLLPFRGDVIGSSSDGRVITSPQDNGALVLDRDHPDQPIPLTSHRDTRFTAVSPDGNWAATGSHSDTKVKVWAARTGGKPERVLPVETGSQVGFSPNGKWLATTGGGLSLWAVGSWNPGEHIGGGPFAFSPDPDCKLLAVETGHGVIRLVNPDGGREYARLEDPNQEPAYRICFSPDGAQLIAPTQASQSVHIWDLPAIREQLAKMDLDWDLPPYPPAAADADKPLRVEVDLGDLGAMIQAQDYWQRALLLALYPDPSRDPRPAVELGTKAVQLAPKDGNCWFTLGVAQYRAGNWKAALESLEKGMPLRNGGGDCGDWFFLAMVHWQLGDKAQARQWYEKADQWMATHDNIGLSAWSPAWPPLRAEAAELLGIGKKKD